MQLSQCFIVEILFCQVLNLAEAIEWLFASEVRWYHVSWGFFFIYSLAMASVVMAYLRLLFSEDLSQTLMRERRKSVVVSFIGHTCTAVM